jgi:hypothetical protein
VGDSRLRLPADNLLNGQTAQRFQLRSRSFASHAAENNKSPLTWITFLTCESVGGRHDFLNGAAAPWEICYLAFMNELGSPGCQALQRRVAEREARVERLTRLLE